MGTRFTDTDVSDPAGDFTPGRHVTDLTDGTHGETVADTVVEPAPGRGADADAELQPRTVIEVQEPSYDTRIITRTAGSGRGGGRLNLSSFFLSLLRRAFGRRLRRRR